MSIVARSPRTLHQKSQAATLAKKAASKPAKPFGFGIVTSPVVAPSRVVMHDCGAVSASPRNPMPSDSVSDEDKAWWAAESAEMEKRRVNRQIMADFLEAEAREEVMEGIIANNLAWADNELMEARRFESYGW